MQELIIKKTDVLKQMYFVLSLIQDFDGPVRSRIGSKNDYMGGLLDRFGNTIVESFIFTNILFPKINTNKRIRLIRDFYNYDPTKTGIAPDLFGIIVDKTAIPFVEYNDGWKPVPNKPQVEIKTLKTRQRMMSLVNQHYDNNYLIFAESDLKVDYLMPFIDSNLFSDELYKEICGEMNLYNDKLILNDTQNYITKFDKISFKDESIGKLKVLLITKAKDFMKIANLAGKGVTPECIDIIEELKVNKNEPIALKNYCDEIQKNYFRFNDNWYSLNESYRNRSNKVTLDFYCSDIKSVDILRMNKNSFNIQVRKPITLNTTQLAPGNYSVKLASGFDRSGTTNDEYFMDKSLNNIIKNYEDELLKEFKQIIDNN